MCDGSRAAVLEAEAALGLRAGRGSQRGAHPRLTDEVARLRSAFGPGEDRNLEPIAYETESRAGCARPSGRARIPKEHHPMARTAPPLRSAFGPGEDRNATGGALVQVSFGNGPLK
jgi:hypothetical protein